jgi:hypothetical protein
MTCIPLLSTPNALQERSQYRPAILERAGRPMSTCYSDPRTRLVMAATEQQAGDYLTATEVATQFTDPERS